MAKRRPLIFMKISPCGWRDIPLRWSYHTGRRDEQQQTHEVRALGIAGRTNLLGKVIADNRQIHFIHQLVPHKG